MKSAITLLSVLALMGYATSLPNWVHRQGHKPHPEQFMLHDKGEPTASNGVIHRPTLLSCYLRAHLSFM